MNAALVHRGPDAQRYVVHQNVALGHTRLSIVDIEGGQQPMLSDDERYALVFNGEIYNYRELRNALKNEGINFKTHSDTEVVLQLYIKLGADCVHKLRGMFAFAVHDRQQQHVFLVRDRLGIKPLFYYHDKNTFIAASEIKALFASGRVSAHLNTQAIRNYFTFQFSTCPTTPFKNIYELPPGYQVTLRKNAEPQFKQYWDLHFPREGEYESLEEDYWTEMFANALGDATASHTIGDVPIGAYLSGGIDSSAITWQLTRHYPQPLTTFSIHFTNKNMDESAIYRTAAAHLKVRNRELIMDDEREGGFLKELVKCIYFLEQPQRMAVDIPHYLLSAMVNEANYKVVYTGDGADEILGGYDCFRQDYMRYWGNQLKNYRLRRRHYLTEYTKYFPEDHVRLLLRLHKPKKQKNTRRQFGCYPAWYDFWHITEDMLEGLFTPQTHTESDMDAEVQQLADTVKPKLQGLHALNQSLYIETKTRLSGWILWKSDRLSMANGVEARVPFMDHQLVELAARIPPSFKLNGMDEKYILKKIARPNLPTHPADHKKRAFYTPIREWLFTKKNMPLLESYLSVENLLECGIFNPPHVRSKLTQLVNLPPPQNPNEHYHAMKLEWVLCLVLTTQILYSQFVRGDAPCFNIAD